MKALVTAVVFVGMTLGSLHAETGLPKSKLCRFRGGGFAYAGGIALPISMTMTNDGGWCGHLAKTVLGSGVFGVPTHVSRQPAHGQVSIDVLSGGTNVSYRPDQAYHGPDSFSVWNEMINIERTYNVVVR